MKRFFDFILGTFAFIVLSPLLIPVMVILKLTGEHYVFYIQERVTKDGNLFGLLKFATMLKNSPNIGTGDITTKNDPRVLPFGRILRKTKINELPQVINVIKGDMSIIGPRPLTGGQFDFYSDEVKEVICKMSPGLSGVGSIVFRDEETIISNSGIPHREFYEKNIAPYKGELEKWYFDNQTIWLDFKLIILTILVILNPKLNVYKVLKGLPERPDFLK